MKLFIFIFHVSYLLTNFINESQSGHNPLTLYVTNGYYEVEEFETVRTKILGHRPKDGESGYICNEYKLQALLCCPADPEIYNVLYFVNIVQKLIYNKDEIDEAAHMCNQKYIPTRKIFPLARKAFADNPTEGMMIYEIGYEVCDENKLINHLCPYEINLRKQEKKCDFFAKLALLHDAEEYRTHHTRYELTDSANVSHKPCKKGYTFDEEWNKEKALKIKAAYSRESQYVILKHIILSSIGFDSFPVTATTWKEQVREHRPFLKAQHLAPKEDFHNEVFGYAACNYLNMAPMWKSVGDGAWQNVENLIRSLAAALFRQIQIRMKDKTTWFRANKEHVVKSNVGQLTIITGTNGVLKVQTSEKDGLEEKELYLLQENSITVPVPEKFWKVVMYEVPAVEGKFGYRYGIFLVTDNANMPLGNKLCDEDICKETGWDIVNNGVNTRTYCCPINERNWRRFGVSFSLFSLPIKVLNLNSILTRNVDGEMVMVDVFEKLELLKQNL